MVRALVDLDENTNRVLNVVKAIASVIRLFHHSLCTYIDAAKNNQTIKSFVSIKTLISSK